MADLEQAEAQRVARSAARRAVVRAERQLITGASRGLGRALTERLLERGDRVAATLRTPRARRARERLGDRLWVRELDVCDVGGCAGRRRSPHFGAST